jgi:hypothetical protein
LSSHLPCTEAFCDDFAEWTDFFQRELAKHASKAVENLFAAVLLLAERKLCHNDIKWEHLALLPVFSCGKPNALHPILIDLADVEDKANVKEAFTAMYQGIQNMLSERNDQEEFASLTRAYQQRKGVKLCDAL